MRAAHGPDADHPPPGTAVTHHVEGEAGCAFHALVGHQAPRLEQLHRSPCCVDDLEADRAQQFAPALDRDRPSADLDAETEVLGDVPLLVCWETVGNQAQLVDPVPTARSQHAERFRNDRPLALLGLHAQHRLTEHHRRTVVVEAGGPCMSIRQPTVLSLARSAPTRRARVRPDRPPCSCAAVVPAGARLCAPTPAPSFTTSSAVPMSRRFNRVSVSSRTPGRSTRFPNFASSQGPGCWSGPRFSDRPRPKQSSTSV